MKPEKAAAARRPPPTHEVPIPWAFDRINGAEDRRAVYGAIKAAGPAGIKRAQILIAVRLPKNAVSWALRDLTKMGRIWRNPSAVWFDATVVPPPGA